MQSEIPFIRPRFPPPHELAQDYADVLDANWFTNFGPKERRFADAIGTYLGPNISAATYSNGTLALVAALELSIGHGDRTRYLLMPSFTFVAVAQAALWAGYLPWFVDVDPETWQPSVASARAALEAGRDRIAGLLFANVFGVGSPAIAEWEILAAEYGLPLVIDSAAGFGSEYPSGERVGGRGTCEIFSFHATKPFAIGEGGGLTSRDHSLVENAVRFGNFGFGAGRTSTQLGINGKLQEINAAIGLRQLDELDARIASRRAVFERYRTGLSGTGVVFQPNAAASSLCFASVLCGSVAHKSDVLASMVEHRVQARDYYNPAVHAQPFFTANPQLSRSESLPATVDLCARIVSLPIHDDMPPGDVERVIAAAWGASQ